MWLYTLSIIFLSIFIWFQLKWRRVKNYWRIRKVPHHSPHPIMGSLSYLQKENPAIWLKKITQEFQTPYVGIWLFWRPGLVINSPEIAKNILIKDADVFRNRFLSSGKTDPIGGLNLFTVNDPVWTTVRRHLTPVFTSAKLKSFQEIPASKSKCLVERIISDTNKGLVIDIRDVFSDYTTDVIGETAFGMVSNSTRLEESPLREITKEFMKFSVFRGLSWSSIFFFPKMVDIFGFSLFPKNTVTYLTDIFRAMVQQRGGYGKESTSTKNLFEVLLKIRQDAAKKGEDIHENLLIAQAAIFLQAGFDTTAVTLTYTTYELAFQPHLQERLHRELVEAKQSSTLDKLDSETLSELPFLNAVLKETLRKYPPMGWLDRVALKEYKMNERLTISAGTVVYVNAVGMHWNQDYFPEPEKYDPGRFLPGKEEQIEPYTYMPFGVGPRHCIGERFANQSLRYALAAVILNFEVRPVPGSLEPSECSIEKRGLFLTPAEKMTVQFIPRRK